MHSSTPVFALFRPLSAHRAHTWPPKLLASGNWRFQVRRKGQYVSETFRRQKDGEEWALDIERRIDRGEQIVVRAKKDPKTIGDLIDLHVSDMTEVGKPPLRSKRFTLEALKESLGKVKLNGLTRERLIKFGKDRALSGAGPATLGMDIGYLRTVIVHAAAVHGVGISAEPIDLARVALKRLELVGKGNERDRRPTKNEIARIVIYLNSNPRQLIPAGRIVLFAIASAMREDEICRIRWESPPSAQRFLTTHAAVYNTFHTERHLISRNTLRTFRADAHAAWAVATAFH